MKTRNSETLASFVAYCQAHPEERFWQALRNWSSYHFIWVSKTHPLTSGDGFLDDVKDTFNWEGRDG